MIFEFRKLIFEFVKARGSGPKISIFQPPGAHFRAFRGSRPKIKIFQLWGLIFELFQGARLLLFACCFPIAGALFSDVSSAPLIVF